MLCTQWFEWERGVNGYHVIRDLALFVVFFLPNCGDQPIFSPLSCGASSSRRKYMYWMPVFILIF